MVKMRRKPVPRPDLDPRGPVQRIEIHPSRVLAVLGLAGYLRLPKNGEVVDIPGPGDRPAPACMRANGTPCTGTPEMKVTIVELNNIDGPDVRLDSGPSSIANNCPEPH